MALHTQLHTAADLLALPNDGWRYELVRGELRQMPPAGSEHGGIAVNLTVSLGQYVKAHQLGRVFAAETGFVLTRDPDTVRAPDLAFVRQERDDAVGRVPGYWPGAPDLAVEVISAHDTYSEVEEKVQDWLAAGTRMVLVVDPRKRTATVYRPSAAAQYLTAPDTLDGGEVVPGWTMPVRELFV